MIEQRSKTTNQKRLAAILLAAGQSRRMGQFKPLLPFGDKTVIESCIDYLVTGGVTDLVVVVGHRANDVRNALRSTSAKFALNPIADSEMSASIASGIGEIEGSNGAVLIALVDHPAVTTTVVQSLAGEWRNDSRIVIPTWHGRGGHPVLVDLGFRDALSHLDSAKGLKGFLDAQRTAVKHLPVDCPFIARDIDTWDDYTALHCDVFGKLPRLVDQRKPDWPHPMD
ncbi:MAG: NTP transferase domain-containing protein [Pyrinomonadaceae bacterium]